MQFSKYPAKKLYEYILSAREASEGLRDCLSVLLRRTIQSPEHFDFLLHRVNWFENPLYHYQEQLIKILRIYRAYSKQSPKVIYNLIIESLIRIHSNQQALNCLSLIFQESFEKKDIICALKENYPHKLCELETHLLYLNSMVYLCKTFLKYRTDFLEIIIENLVNFDTEVTLGDEWVHVPFPEDQKIMELRESAHTNELSVKFDNLLHQFLVYLKELIMDEQIMDEMLLVFQNKILPIKTTKSIQFVVFAIAESSKGCSSRFISFLLGNIFDNRYDGTDFNKVNRMKFNSKQNWYRIFTQSNFYLFSYIIRSKRINNNAVLKILNILIEKYRERLSKLQPVVIEESVDLKNLFNANEILLIALQTIIMIKLHFQLNEVSINETYNRLIDQSHSKLHFEYFLREQILQRMKIDKMDNKNNIVLKFSNKFLPCTLPMTGNLIDPLVRVQKSQKRQNFRDLQEFEPGLRKMQKGQTPISYCEETIIM